MLCTYGVVYMSCVGYCVQVVQWCSVHVVLCIRCTVVQCTYGIVYMLCMCCSVHVILCICCAGGCSLPMVRCTCGTHSTGVDACIALC